MIGDEAREQALAAEGALPARVIACVGGGSNSIGIFTPFIDDAEVELIGVEAAGEGLDTDRHGASLGKGSTGVLHGSLSSVIADEEGQILEAHSISAGLDYPGVGPEHAYLRDTGRASYFAVTDAQALAAFVGADAAGGDHSGAGVVARDRLVPGEQRRRRWLRRAVPLREGRQGLGRGAGVDRREGSRGMTRWSNSGEDVAEGSPGVVSRSNSGEAPGDHPRTPSTRASAGSERIAAAFRAAKDEGRAALMPYMMAGYPDRETSLAVAEAYAESADLVELGVPFSDPLADGPDDSCGGYCGA